MVRKRATRKQYGPKDFMRPFYKGTWQGMFTFWNNPAMWSDQMIHKTLREIGGKPYTARDVRFIIKSYCKIMRDFVKRSETF
jgi:hypothetical protein